MKSITLNNNAQMPIVGLGTWRAKPEEMEVAMKAALDAGYRHIDTAFNYGTEATIGDSISEWIKAGSGQREDLFITTKLPNFGNRSSDVEKFIDLSLNKLQLSYVDLYLMHMPFSFHFNEVSVSPLVNEDGTFSLDLEADILETWKTMETQVDEGKAKAIGLSNCNEEQVKRIYDNARIKPAVLQVELHAYLQQKNLRALCKSLNIAVTAYSPLGSPGANSHFANKYNYSLNDFPDILGHPVVQEIAKNHNKSPGQILLRHLIQQDIIVIPKSGNPERIKQNIDIFNYELNSEEMAELNKLDKGENGRIFDFLFFKGVEKHPEYPFKQRLEGW